VVVSSQEEAVVSEQVSRFRIETDQTVLDDLRDRLRRTRWPERETVPGWTQGVPLGYVQELCRYWAQGYDWRATEARLNRLPQFRTEIDGLGIHFVVDSPAALCAWLIEKFWAWTDCDGHLENVLTRDELLDNLMLYWLPGTGASSARLYWQSFKQVQQRFRVATTDVVAAPTGCSIFPKENPRPSRRWAEKRFTDIRYWNEPSKGGHFAAFEQPELFVEEVRSFFRTVR
jgi:pimeloyl-ACP methyl ester carboxylesterase